MKQCKKCGTLLSDVVTTCGKCGQPVDESAGTKSANSFEAIKSETHSASYYKYRGGYVETWMYVVTVLCPLIGIIFGSISYAKGENEASKKLIVTSIVASVAVLVLWAIILFACIDFLIS